MDSLTSEKPINQSGCLSSRLLTVRQFATSHPAFPEGGLRYLIFNANKNGFKSCIKRVGRKVLIDEASFFAWVNNQNGVDESHGRQIL